MKILNKIFAGIDKALTALERTRKILQSVEIVGKHAKNMNEELKAVWKFDEQKTEETGEV